MNPWLAAVLGGVGTGIGGAGQAIAAARTEQENRALKQQALDLEREKIYEDPTPYLPIFKAAGLDITPYLNAGKMMRASAVPGLVAQAQKQQDIAREEAANRTYAATLRRDTPPVTTMLPDVGAERAFDQGVPTEPVSAPSALTALPAPLRAALGMLESGSAGKEGRVEAFKAIQEANKPIPVSETTVGYMDPTTRQITPVPGMQGRTAEPPLREGYQRTYHQDVRGRPSYSDAIKLPPEKESAISDWLAAHPREVAGLDTAAARDKARQEIEKRTITTRVELAQPTLSTDAVDRAADYYNQTGQLPANLGFANPRLRTQIMDRAAQRALAEPGDIGLAARQASYQANKAEQAKLQTQRGPIIAFMRTAEDHLKRAEALSATVPRTEIPALNRWLLSGQTNWTGNPETAAFAAVTRLATNEVARVISSTTGAGGVISDEARREVQDVLRPAFATGQFSAVVQALRGLMQDRAAGYEAMIQATNDRINRLGSGTAASSTSSSGVDMVGRANELARQRYGKPYGALDDKTRHSIFNEVSGQK